MAKYKEWMTTGEAAKELGFSLQGVKNWIKAGNVFQPDCVRKTPGGHWHIKRDEVLRVKRSLLQGKK